MTTTGTPTGTPQGTTGSRTTRHWVIGALGILAFLVAGGMILGQLGDGGAEETAALEDGVSQGELVAVSMTEFAFEPGSLELDAGTYTFEVTNDGVAPHQWALSAAGDHGVHGADTGVIDPGETATVTVTLEGGVYEFACHVPGHYEAGMFGELTVPGTDGVVPEPVGDGHADEPMAGDEHDDDMAAEEDMATADGHDDAMAGDDHGVTDAAAAGQPVAVSMVEFGYEPAELTVPAGAVTFTVTNDGAVPHEFALASAGEHTAHDMKTRQLAPGETQELTLDLMPGTYEFMCHIEGHLEAGMVGTLTVTG